MPPLHAGVPRTATSDHVTILGLQRGARSAPHQVRRLIRRLVSWNLLRHGSLVTGNGWTVCTCYVRRHDGGMEGARCHDCHGDHVLTNSCIGKLPDMPSCIDIYHNFRLHDTILLLEVTPKILRLEPLDNHEGPSGLRGQRAPGVDALVNHPHRLPVI